MNQYTLESFINFCDDMQIAEEKGLLGKLFKKKKSNQTKKIYKVNKAYLDRVKYNEWDTDGCELMTDEELSICNQKYVPEFKNAISKIKDIAQKINNKYKKPYITFIPDSMKNYEIILNSKKDIEIEAYPVGVSYETLTKFKDATDLSDAMDEFLRECTNIIRPTTIIKPDIQFCKDNCDGYPEYVHDYRFFLWFSVVFKE